MKKYSYPSYEQFLVDSRPNQASPRARGQRLVAGPPPPPRAWLVNTPPGSLSCPHTYFYLVIIVATDLSN